MTPLHGRLQWSGAAKTGVVPMKLVLAALALACATVAIVPASALSVPRCRSPAPIVETVQQTPPSNPSPHKGNGERCFVGCWNSCWGFHCVERCRCRCSDVKPDYCTKLIWGLRFI